MHIGYPSASWKSFFSILSKNNIWPITTTFLIKLKIFVVACPWLLLNLVLCIYFWIQNHIKRFYHILIWSFGHIFIIDWPFEGNCFEFIFSKGSIFAHAGKYQEHYRLFTHSFTRISKIVLEFKMCFSSNIVECHFDLSPGFYVICVNYTLKHRALSRTHISLNLYMSFFAQNTLSQNDPRNTSMDHAVIHVNL